MKRNYYIFSAGRLVRKDNTLFFEAANSDDFSQDDENLLETENIEQALTAEENPISSAPLRLTRRPIPVADIEAIYCFAELKFNTRFLQFVAQKQITLHLFNYYGFYSGSFYPREPFISGRLLVKQVSAYEDSARRMTIARRFVEGAGANILKNLRYYDVRERDMSPFIPKIVELMEKIPLTNDVQELMGIEGNIRSTYYTAWNLILSDGFTLDKRVKNPPDNAVNAMISFGNSLVYTAVLSEIYKTQLNPLISYLHEPGERRFSLSLDIAEIFKPLLADRIIFSLLNKKQIQPKHFSKGLNFCHLNDEGRKIFVKEFDDKLATTIQHRGLKRQVSYRRLIRLECYKIIKHLLGEKQYEPFKIWW